MPAYTVPQKATAQRAHSSASEPAAMPPHNPEGESSAPSYHSSSADGEGLVKGAVVVGSPLPCGRLGAGGRAGGAGAPQAAAGDEGSCEGLHAQLAVPVALRRAARLHIRNLHYLKGKTMSHPEESLEQVVEDLVTTWELERSHKLSHVQHKSVDQQALHIGANGGRRFDSVEANKVGNNNVLLDSVDPALWPQDLSRVKSHHLFKEAFPAAFPWEALKVFSGPPKVAFSWRDWAHFWGAYRGKQGKRELVEMSEFPTATVSAELKLQEVEVFYKLKEFLKVLEGKLPASALSRGASLLGSGFPVLSQSTGGGSPFKASQCGKASAQGNNDGGSKGGRCIILWKGEVASVFAQGDEYEYLYIFAHEGTVY